ncbi:hypothetical protein HYY72_04085 [Candidatus Woesearchaeota archaeon]|nr:hypothetical protein [Candidatus Woesearchaeota archaeon]
MYVLKGEAAKPQEDESDDEEFLKKLGQEGFASGSENCARESGSVYENLRKALGKKKGSGTGFVQVKKGLDELVSVQSEINRALRVESSSALYMGMYIANGIVHRLTGKRAEPKTLEQLFEEEIRVVSGLISSVAGTSDYSRDVLDSVVKYRDFRVLPARQQAIADYVQAEHRAKEIFELFQETEQRLGRTMIASPNYAELYRAHGALQREMMLLYNEMSKSNQSTDFRTTELKILTMHIGYIQHGVLLLDRLNSRVSDVVEHVENTREPFRFFRESHQGMSAVYMAFSEISRCVMLAVDEMGREISMMSDMAQSATSHNGLPEVIERMLSGYRSSIFAAEEKSRQAFTSRADSIRNSYGPE